MKIIICGEYRAHHLLLLDHLRKLNQDVILIGWNKPLIPPPIKYYRIIPEPLLKTEKYKDKLTLFRKIYFRKLENVLKEERPDVIIPLTEHHIKYISLYKRRLEKKFRAKVLGPNYRSFVTILDKIKAYSLSKLGLKFPHRFSFLPSLLSKDFPVFIKPNIGAGGFLAKRVTSLDEAKKHIRKILKEGKKPLIQEYMEFKRGGVLNLFCYNGDVIDGYFVINFNRKGQKIKEFLGAIERVARYLRWTGFLSFQFRVDTNGVFFIQEINPRLSVFAVDAYLFFDWKNILEIINTSEVKRRKIRVYDYLKEIRRTRRNIKGYLYLAKKRIITVH